jgi:pimeloyl-ACP methyl ester carboxylesterase
LAGHSFGGYISTFYYEKYSERVKQLVLLSSAGSGKLSEEAINARAQRSKFFFWFAEKVFSWDKTFESDGNFLDRRKIYG